MPGTMQLDTKCVSWWLAGISGMSEIKACFLSFLAISPQKCGSHLANNLKDRGSRDLIFLKSPGI